MGIALITKGILGNLANTIDNIVYYVLPLKIQIENQHKISLLIQNINNFNIQAEKIQDKNLNLKIFDKNINIKTNNQTNINRSS